MKNIYLDYAATTPMDSRVKAAMEPYFSEKFGNPGALYKIGQEASAAVFKARTKIAESIGADYKEIIFTGSATEANNLALRGIAKRIRNNELGIKEKKKNIIHNSKFIIPRIIVSAIEHSSVLETCRDLAAEGAEIIYIPVSREGIVDLEKLKAALNERTVLVSVMYANNEVGAIQPISKISEIVGNFRGQIAKRKSQGINDSRFAISAMPLLHTDAVQAFQYLNCNVNKLGVDMMTLSAHKIYGPKGIGALYIKNLEFSNQNLGTKKSLYSKSYILNPMITGGGQEWGLRSGTENVASIAGFAKAVELVSNSRELENKRISKLRDYLWAKIRKIDPKIKLNGSAKQRLPNNLNIYFPKQKSGELLIKLDLLGVSVSAGAACSARTIQPSYVLGAMGFSRDRCAGSLRFSLGRPTKLEDIEEVIKRVKMIAKR